MEAHRDDLRSEANDPQWSQAIRNGDATVLNRVDQALVVFAIKLTREPWSNRARDVQTLRAVGLCDRAIHDAVQVIAYFNYINRIADGLGVDLEPGMAKKPMDSA